METIWSKSFPCVMPKPVKLNPDSPAVSVISRKDAQVFQDVFDYGYVVPFIESLEKVLNIKAVWKAVQSSFISNASPKPSSYSDVWDGSVIRSNPTFLKLNGAVLAIQIYNDEVELMNPLGSKKGKHKVSVFYWTLLNLPTHCRSSLRSINLLAIINAELLRKHGFNHFLKPFLDDMLLLNNGHCFSVRGEKITLHGILAHSVGDMPASNLLAGFKEGVGRATHHCRFCMIHRNDMDCVFHEQDCVLRTKVDHDKHLEELSRESSSKASWDAMSADFGVTGPCPLSILPYFHPVEGFPHDLMHVLYEGVLNQACGQLLRCLISDFGLDLDEVNRRISLLESGREFTVPPNIREDEVLDNRKLSFSSSEMEALCTVLPLVLGDFVSSQNCPQYENFILLLEISASLQCYCFEEKDLNLLNFNIETYHRKLVVLHPKQNGGNVTTPKTHSFHHFVSQIRMFGSPRVTWCYRFESANAPIKKTTRQNCNFHNVPMTVATHQQRLQGLAIRLYGEGDFFEVENDFKAISFSRSCKSRLGNKHSVLSSPWSFSLQHPRANLNLEPTDCIREIVTAKVGGRFCKVGTVFLKKGPELEKFPVFFRIAHMVLALSKNKVIFIMEELETSFFWRDKFSFVVRPSGKFDAIKDGSLKFLAPLHSFFLDGKIHVVPNYYHLL